MAYLVACVIVVGRTACVAPAISLLEDIEASAVAGQTILISYPIASSAVFVAF